MKSTLRGLAMFLALVGLALPSWADTKDDAKPPPKPSPRTSVPLGAKVLFDGKDFANWMPMRGKPDDMLTWKIIDGYMECGRGDIMTKEKFGPDFQVHIEFWLPLMADAKGQGRANSGVYLQGRYEIQVLDSYMNETYQNGSVGALYGIIAPDKAAQEKAVKPPEEWNSYDITFVSPRVGDDGKVTKKGQLTVKLNGVAIIDHGEFDKVTGGAMDEKLGEPGPLRLQDHGNKVRFRNVWIKPL